MGKLRKTSGGKPGKETTKGVIFCSQMHVPGLEGRSVWCPGSVREYVTENKISNSNIWRGVLTLGCVNYTMYCSSCPIHNSRWRPQVVKQSCWRVLGIVR